MIRRSARISCQDIGVPLAGGSTSRRWSAASRVESAVLARWWSLLWSTTCLTFRLLWMARLWPSRSALRSAQSAGGIRSETIRCRESASPWVIPHQPRMVQATDSDFFAGSPQVKALPVPEGGTGAAMFRRAVLPRRPTGRLNLTMRSAFAGRLKLPTRAGNPGWCPFDSIAQGVGPAPSAAVVRMMVVSAGDAIVVGGFDLTGGGVAHRREGTGPHSSVCARTVRQSDRQREASERRRTLPEWPPRYDHGQRSDARWPWPIDESLAFVLYRVG